MKTLLPAIYIANRNQMVKEADLFGALGRLAGHGLGAGARGAGAAVGAGIRGADATIAGVNRLGNAAVRGAQALPGAIGRIPGQIASGAGAAGGALRHGFKAHVMGPVRNAGLSFNANTRQVLNSYGMGQPLTRQQQGLLASQAKQRAAYQATPWMNRSVGMNTNGLAALAGTGAVGAGANAWINHEAGDDWRQQMAGGMPSFHMPEMQSPVTMDIRSPFKTASWLGHWDKSAYSLLSGATRATGAAARSARFGAAGMRTPGTSFGRGATFVPGMGGGARAWTAPAGGMRGAAQPNAGAAPFGGGWSSAAGGRGQYRQPAGNLWTTASGGIRPAFAPAKPSLLRRLGYGTLGAGSGYGMYQLQQQGRSPLPQQLQPTADTGKTASFGTMAGASGKAFQTAAQAAGKAGPSAASGGAWNWLSNLHPKAQAGMEWLGKSAPGQWAQKNPALAGGIAGAGLMRGGEYARNTVRENRIANLSPMERLMMAGGLIFNPQGVASRLY